MRRNQRQPLAQVASASRVLLGDQDKWRIALNQVKIDPLHEHEWERDEISLCSWNNWDLIKLTEKEFEECCANLLWHWKELKRRSNRSISRSSHWRISRRSFYTISTTTCKSSRALVRSIIPPLISRSFFRERLSYIFLLVSTYLSLSLLLSMIILSLHWISFAP